MKRRQKILKIDLLEALRMALNFFIFLSLFQAIIFAQNTSFDQILQIFLKSKTINFVNTNKINEAKKKHQTFF